MVNLINADCIDVMATFKDKQFDLAIVDPPYGIGMDGGNVGYKGFNNFEKKDWDKETPNDKYWKELFRVSQNQIVWGGNYFGLPASRCWVIWDKGEGFYNRTYAEAELAWTSFNANVKIYKRDPLAKGDYKGKIHPTQKPIQLYKFLLVKFASAEFKILDTHLGSGSIAIACHDLGYNLIGIEIDKEYYDAAVKRYNQHKAQLQIW